MARIGIVFGLLLCGLTIVGMSVTTQKTYTQFVPMMFGIPMLFLGVVSLNPHRRPSAVLLALILSMAAITMGFGRLVVFAVQFRMGDYVNPISLRLVLVMTTLSLVFAVIAGLWRRRRRQAAELLKLNPNATSSVIASKHPGRPYSTPPPFSDNPYQSPPILDETVTPNSEATASDSPVSDRPVSDSPAANSPASDDPDSSEVNESTAAIGSTKPDSSNPPLSRSEST